MSDKPPYFLDPGPLCWECGTIAPLKCVEGYGWLCKPCRDAHGQTVKGR